MLILASGRNSCLETMDRKILGISEKCSRLTKYVSCRIERWLSYHVVVGLFVAGENLLAVVKAMADSPYLTHPDEFRHGRLIFFDFVGLFMVVYSARLGSILNFIAAFATFFRVVSKIFQRRRGKGVCCVYRSVSVL